MAEPVVPSPTIPPITKLAMAMRTKRGSYSLLLGSGVSTAASIPTGWKILQILIHQVAALYGEDTGDRPEDWYLETFHEEADYSVLLDRLTDTPAERRNLIRGFVEPTQEERELGFKLPTDAHRAIAELVSGGYVRVIVTTNFDRLLEMALGEIGVVPTVIDSDYALAGALPIVHNDCTIIKLNGDYIDTRIRNTRAELEEYEDGIDALLRRVLADYGLVVCGWSGDWDTGLVRAVSEVRSAWFGTNWSSFRAPREAAQELIELRGAEAINNMDANTFFQLLADNIRALESLAAPGDVSTAVMKETVKRLVDDPVRRIRLHDLVVGEARRVRTRIDEQPDDSYRLVPDREGLEAILTGYEKSTELLRTILAHGCYWGREDQDRHWVEAIRKLVLLEQLNIHGAQEGLLTLRLYPALLSVYTAGMASIASGNFRPLASLVFQIRTKSLRPELEKPLPVAVKTSILGDRLPTILQPNAHVLSVLPFRLRLRTELWNPLMDYFENDDDRIETMTRFEYIYGMCGIDADLQRGFNNYSASIGSFRWTAYGDDYQALIQAMQNEIDGSGEAWPPLRAGLFGGSLERLRAAKAGYDVQLRRLN